jgi:hypothetical protein
LAERNALNVDAAIDEIMRGEAEEPGPAKPPPITDEDIPF